MHKGLTDEALKAQFEQLKAIEISQCVAADTLLELKRNEWSRLAVKDRGNVHELKQFLDQNDSAMPDYLIIEQAKECYTYSIAKSMVEDNKARQELFDGLAGAYAEQEGAASSAVCSVRGALNYIFRVSAISDEAS